MPKEFIISADSHAEEAGDIHQRLPEHYRARAPHLKEVEGRRYWMVEGMAPQPMDTPNPLKEEDLRKEFRWGEETGVGLSRESGTDIAVREADMEEDGITAEVIYPNGIFKAFASPDPEFQLAICKLYNDFYLEIFGEHFDKFIPSATIPMADIGAAMEETKRVVGLGYRSLSVPVSRPSKPYSSHEYKPFWALVEDLDVPLSFHVFTRSEPNDEEPEFKDLVKEEGDGSDLWGMVLGMSEALSPLCMLTAAGVLERHPTLKFVLVEGGVGWLAWVLDALDEINDKRHMWAKPVLELKPSEYFKRQGYATFGDDRVGLHNLVFTGADSLMWGSDYPHDEGTFPNSREVIDRTFKDLAPEDKKKVTAENAANLYKIPLADSK